MVTTSTKVPLLWNGCIIKTICWVSSISSVPTVMQMSCNVWEPSDWFRWGTIVRKSEVNGNGHKSSEKFGSRNSSEYKGRTFELLLYISQTWTYMCKRRSQLRYVGLSPAQCAWAKQNACVEENMGKHFKTGRKLKRKRGNYGLDLNRVWYQRV